MNKKTRDSWGNLPLNLAVSRDSATVHLLLKRGARINEADNAGNTGLHEACKNNLETVAALLVQFGANMNARNWLGRAAFELLPNEPSCGATAKAIIREAVKREALGQTLCEGYKIMAQSCEKYLKIDQKCRAEVEHM